VPKFRDAIRLVEADGWRLVRTRGSHRHYAHPTKPGIVTIAGQEGKDVAPGTWASIMKQAGIKVERPE
jgi:predicted RNA binding protein YcfA (HicA-like mRNA interferase family)